MAETPESRALCSFLDKLDDESKSRKNLLLGETKFGEYLRLFRGKAVVPQNNPFFQANFVGVELERKAALLAENKPELRVSPRRTGLKATADILQSVLRAEWDEVGMSDKLETGVLLMEIMGPLIFGIEWDAASNYGLGALKLYLIDPRCFRLDPSITYCENLDDAQYIIVDSLVPLYELRRQYPGLGVEVPADPRSSLFPTDDRAPVRGPMGAMANVLRNVLTPGEKVAGALPLGYVRSYWFRDPALITEGQNVGQLMFPYGRHVIRGGEKVILHDGPNEYFDGTWPFVMTNGKLDPNHPWGRSEADGLRRLSEAVNRIGHLFVDNTIRGGSGRVIADTDALSAEDKNKLSNIGMQIISKKFGREIKWDPPMQMPPHMLDFIRFAMQLFDVLTGMADSAGGRKEVRSGAMLEGLQTASQTLVRQQARRLEGMLERLGQKWISRIFQFYQDSRVMTLFDGQQFQEFVYEREQLLAQLAQEASDNVYRTIQQEQQKAAQNGMPTPLVTDEARQGMIQARIIETIRAAWRDFRFKITPGSSLASTKMQRAIMWGELAKNGLASPKHVLKELGVENPDEEIKEAVQYHQLLQALGLNQPGDKGKSSSKAKQGIAG